MFTSLHALAKRATLMITIAAEGEDELRVNVTPVPDDGKSKAQLPQPLSLRATPAEFDADFIAALATWQAPKRSLVQQAQEAAEGQEPAAPGNMPKAPIKQDKPGRKSTRAGKSAAEPQAAGESAAGEAAGEAADAAGEVTAGGAASGAIAPEGEPERGAAPAPAAADQAQVDTLTLDLF